MDKDTDIPYIIGLQSFNSADYFFSGGIELVAKGSLLSVEPDRIITKRAVLSGYPLKINKKSCVVRYMFFNRGMYI